MKNKKITIKIVLIVIAFLAAVFSIDKITPKTTYSLEFVNGESRDEWLKKTKREDVVINIEEKNLVIVKINKLEKMMLSKNKKIKKLTKIILDGRNEMTTNL